MENGDAMISEKHCNFIVNLKNANAYQIEELAQNVNKKFLKILVLNLTGK